MTACLHYRREVFVRRFRKLVTAAGIPPTVWNMDSRAGAISEAVAAGARFDDVVTTATHTNPTTTLGYARDRIAPSRRVAERRFRRESRGE
jgi:hypothetical protein